MHIQHLRVSVRDFFIHLPVSIDYGVDEIKLHSLVDVYKLVQIHVQILFLEHEHFFMEHISLNILNNLHLKRLVNHVVDYQLLYNVIMVHEGDLLRIQDAKISNHDHVGIHIQVYG